MERAIQGHRLRMLLFTSWMLEIPSEHDAEVSKKYIREEAPHKHLIFVLNKCDLVPTGVAVGTPFLRILFPSSIVKSRLLLHLRAFHKWKAVCYNFGRLNPFSPLLASGSRVDSSPSWGVCRKEFGSVSFELKSTSALMLVACGGFS